MWFDEMFNSLFVLGSSWNSWWQVLWFSSGTWRSFFL